MRSVQCLLAVLAASVSSQDVTTATTSVAKSSGPYSTISKQLDDSKRASFNKLLKLMRSSALLPPLALLLLELALDHTARLLTVYMPDRFAPPATKNRLPEREKNATRRSQNSAMQKLLGDEMYQRYRAVRVANTAKLVAKAGGGGAPGVSGTPTPREKKSSTVVGSPKTKKGKAKNTKVQ